MHDEDTTTHAADLAERLVDEISHANKDWRSIEACARELAELAAERAAGRAARVADRPPLEQRRGSES